MGYDTRKAAAAPLLAPFVRADLDPTVALATLDWLVTHVAEPRQAERLGISRREAVRTLSGPPASRPDQRRGADSSGWPAS